MTRGFFALSVVDGVILIGLFSLVLDVKGCWYCEEVYIIGLVYKLVYIFSLILIKGSKNYKLQLIEK